MFFLQMAGFPGSGKSTLAREVASQTNAVLINHDVVKSAFLDKLPEMDSIQAGKVSYQIDWSIIESNLSVGNSVILDSPCLYQVMIEKGESLAETYHARYKYVECYLENFQEINYRLKKRDNMLSQISGIESETSFMQALAYSKKPLHHSFLKVDTSRPLNTYLPRVLDYLHE